MNDELVVGSKVRLLRSMLGEPLGSIGFVVEEYYLREDSPKGVSVVFQGGGFDGFSEEEQTLYLENLGVDQRYSTYQFVGVSFVDRDWRNKYWDFR